MVEAHSVGDGAERTEGVLITGPNAHVTVPLSKAANPKGSGCLVNLCHLSLSECSGVARVSWSSKQEMGFLFLLVGA